MQKDYTAAEMEQLLGQLRRLFAEAELTPDGPAAADGGFVLGYETHLDGTNGVLACHVRVDGRPLCLRLSAPVSGALAPDDRMEARELEMYRDDLIRDTVTGVYNRRYWEQKFCPQLAGWAAQGRPAAAALVCIDGLAEITQRHSAAVMDQLLCYVANQWKKYYDEGDEKVVCHLGGPLFVIGCAGADEVDLESQLRVLYDGLAHECVCTVGMMCRVPFTLSIACADLGETGGTDGEALLLLCRQRLERQTLAGGNGVYAAAEAL